MLLWIKTYFIMGYIGLVFVYHNIFGRNTMRGLFYLIKFHGSTNYIDITTVWRPISYVRKSL